MICKSNRTPRYYIFTGSCRGEYHRKLGLANQDCVKYFVSKKGIFLGIADGLGSCKKSHIGARRILETGVDLLKGFADKGEKFSAEMLTEALINRWENIYPPEVLKEYSTTLKEVFVVGEQLIALSCGDGLLLIYDGTNIIRLGQREENRFINETSCFSPNMQKSDVQRIQCQRPNRFIVFMCTDGVSAALDEKKECDLIKNLFEQWRSSSLQEDISELIMEISKYNFDDKTIGVGYYDFTER